MLFLTSTAVSGPESVPGNGWVGILNMVVMFGLMIGLMYFMIFRPQKKKEKEIAKMRRDLEIGDLITTIGGINGRIVSIKDDDLLVIESGPDKTKIRIKRWAIQTNDTISDD